MRLWQNYGEDRPTKPTHNRREWNIPNVCKSTISECGHQRAISFIGHREFENSLFWSENADIHHQRLQSTRAFSFKRKLQKCVSECFPLIVQDVNIHCIMMRGPLLACWPIIPLPPPINIYWAGLGRGSTPSSYPTVATRKKRNCKKREIEKISPSPSHKDLLTWPWTWLFHPHHIP